VNPLRTLNKIIPGKQIVITAR